jgi:GntR family transcriptional regulator
LIRRRQGAGTFVVGQVPIIESGLEVLESLDTMTRRLGLEVSVADLNVEQIYADQEHAEVLGVPISTRLTRVRRVIHETDRPVAYLVDTLPEEVLRREDLPATFKGSVLDFLLERGAPLTVSRAAISATGASADVARPLEIQRGDVLLQFTAKLFQDDGRVLDYSLSYFIPGYFKFHVVRRVGHR